MGPLVEFDFLGTMGTMHGGLRALHFVFSAALAWATVGCGDRTVDTEKVDLVGTPPDKDSHATTPSPPAAAAAVDSVGIDLMQDLVFRKQRDGWTLTDPKAHVTVDKLKSAGIGIVFSALPQLSGPSARKKLLRSAVDMETLLSGTDGKMAAALSFAEAERLVADGRIAVMLLTESGDAFQDDFSLLSVLKKRGLAVAGLVAMRSNSLAESAMAPRERGGLTVRGRAFLSACRDLGILPDLTYASPCTFWDVLAEQAGIALVSHSAARALMDHPRNLDDLQILGLRRYGGLMGLVLNPEFLTQGGDGTLEDAVAHIMHLKALGAISIAALGTDFGGIVPPRDLPDVASLSVFRAALARQGLSEVEIRGVFGENAARFLKSASATFGARDRTVDDILRPAALECDFVSGGGEGRPAAACNGLVRDAGAVIRPSGRIRIRLRDMTVSPVTLEIFGEPRVPWQLEAQNLAGKILFHRTIQLDDDGVGAAPVPSDRNLTRVFLSPTRVSTLKEAVIWGRGPSPME